MACVSNGCDDVHGWDVEQDWEIITSRRGLSSMEMRDLKTGLLDLYILSHVTFCLSGRFELDRCKPNGEWRMTIAVCMRNMASEVAGCCFGPGVPAVDLLLPRRKCCRCAILSAYLVCENWW